MGGRGSDSGSSSRGNNSGSNYTYSKTSSGQGNWNTGGGITGRGSMDGGIVGRLSNYDVAPTKQGSPGMMSRTLADWRAKIAARDASLNPSGYKSISPATLAQIKTGLPVPGLSPSMLAEIQAFLDKVPTATSIPRSITAPYTKAIYDRMPEYDRVPGYDSPWTDIHPRIGNNLVNRIGNPANGAPRSGPGYSW